ncbi:MAG: inositol monophosphatase [Verrucomicrobiae bacterium]|nr:inositol monophosphatase [Verrucomicrobiae bacterium]
MLETAVEAAYAAGRLLRQNFGSALEVHEATQYDVKLEIDRLAQQAITKVITSDFPDHAILGEEGCCGRANAEVRWVIDPLDGTVNYFYGIPIYAVSVAAQRHIGNEQWQTIAGAVYAPELDEMFAAALGEPATLNGQPIRVSRRSELSEAVVGIGFFKSEETIRRALDDFQQLVRRVRKMRLMGAAALDMVYVACGRFDAYIEYGIKLWDICAGQLIVEVAGGRCELQPAGEHAFNVRVTNGKLCLPLSLAT